MKGKNFAKCLKNGGNRLRKGNLLRRWEAVKTSKPEKGWWKLEEKNKENYVYFQDILASLKLIAILLYCFWGNILFPQGACRTQR